MRTLFPIIIFSLLSGGAFAHDLKLQEICTPQHFGYFKFLGTKQTGDVEVGEGQAKQITVWKSELGDAPREIEVHILTSHVFNIKQAPYDRHFFIYREVWDDLPPFPPQEALNNGDSRTFRITAVRFDAVVSRGGITIIASGDEATSGSSETISRSENSVISSEDETLIRRTNFIEGCWRFVS